ncbi:dTMP kinase [Thermovibrio ammonificans]|jgi:dTMP kinase|uniref:Thymidylate kinase n=1 Tax=Thermovibrio ammonificans (strain DSM 15698 / JCM 12110 / HB-1) TaxID=648996 RepID=E8T4X2_THEA1|nr:dTMP kinase [Thermovibrio ammonificans]ADU96384.1 thymidylate kinase [Thermovibrio ammonificans HB-1]
MFITFEGIEGCGKSTQARLTYEWLLDRGYTSVLTREPGGTPAAEKVREVLLKRWEERFPPMAELFLYEAARAFHVENLIKPALQEGSIVICDRFTDSTLAYQSFGRGLSREFVALLNRKATGGLKPDLTLLIDLPVEEAFRRIAQKSRDRMESEPLEFHRRVREGFLSIAREEPERVAVIDGRGTVSEVFERVKRVIEERLRCSAK